VENVRKIDAKVNAKYLLGDSVNADVNDERWKNVDFVFNAAGFNEQRKAVDERAVFFCKPVVDCGIYEASGHTSDNVPFIAEPCNAAMFTPESFPGKWSFPRTVEQCAAFAHHIFDYNYWQCPEAARTYEKTQENRPGLFPRKKILEVFQKPPKDFEDCVRWARKQFEKIFRENISRLLRNFPLDYEDEVGQKVLEWVQTNASADHIRCGEIRFTSHSLSPLPFYGRKCLKFPLTKVRKAYLTCLTNFEQSMAWMCLVERRY
jgi:ubiquitin-activating enzyme E1